MCCGEVKLNLTHLTCGAKDRNLYVSKAYRTNASFSLGLIVHLTIFQYCEEKQQTSVLPVNNIQLPQNFSKASNIRINSAYKKCRNAT